MTKLEKMLLAFCVLLVCWALFAAHREAKLTAAYEADKKVDKQQIADDEQQRQADAVKYMSEYSTLEAEKQKTVTVTQIVHELPKVITLPAAPVQITQKQADAINSADAGLPDAPKITAGDVCFPAADMKPLFDAQITGKECAAHVVQLTADNTALSDEVTTEKKQVQQAELVIKGGTKWRRFRTAIKYVGIGAAIGAGAVVYAEHR